MQRSKICIRFALLALMAWALPACVTTTETRVPDLAPVVPSDPASDETQPSAPRAEPRPAATPAATGDSGLAQVGNAVATVPENILWIPWKIVGSMLKGGSDGVQAGWQKADRMPVVAAVFSPVNLVAGLLTGFVEGIAMSPFLIGPRDNFGRVMKSPTTRTTTIWWYE